MMTKCSVRRVIGSESYDTNVPDGDWHRVSRLIIADHHEFVSDEEEDFCKFCATTLSEALFDL